MRPDAIVLSHVGVVCALGAELARIQSQLFCPVMPQALTVTGQYSADGLTPLALGMVHQALPSLAQVPALYQTRCNAMLWQSVLPILPQILAAKARYGAHRIAIVLGVSTAGLPEGLAARAHWEQTGQWPAGFDYAQQELGQPAEFLAAQLGTSGPQYGVATACSSGAKALASGARLLRAGLADAVIAGGCDVLSTFTVAGFSALESVSAAVCQPLSAHRNGINLGEGSAVFLMERQADATPAQGPAPVVLAGWGETGDAHHMSAPDPSAKGAIKAIELALQRAQLEAAQLDYVNLHGTATVQNDAMESLAVAHVVGHEVAVSSTKPLTGHTLAASGAIEAAFVWLALQPNPTGRLPVHWWDGAQDARIAPLHTVAPGMALGYQPRYALSNSFAFGGSNACLIFAADARP